MTQENIEHPPLAKKEELMLQSRVSKIETKNVPQYTYAELRDRLNALSEAELGQQVEIMPPGSGVTGEDIMLQPVIAVGTVREMCSGDGEQVQMTHSSVDFANHPEQVVLLADGNGYSEDGDSSFLMEEIDGELCFVGNVSGKVKSLIERGRCEPSAKASRTPAFAPRMEQTDEELMALQERLAFQTDPTPEDQYALMSVQAELYRRIYHLKERKRS